MHAYDIVDHLSLLADDALKKNVPSSTVYYDSSYFPSQHNRPRHGPIRNVSDPWHAVLLYSCLLITSMHP